MSNTYTTTMLRAFQAHATHNDPLRGQISLRRFKYTSATAFRNLIDPAGPLTLGVARRTHDDNSAEGCDGKTQHVEHTTFTPSNRPLPAKAAASQGEGERPREVVGFGGPDTPPHSKYVID